MIRETTKTTDMIHSGNDFDFIMLARIAPAQRALEVFLDLALFDDLALVVLFFPLGHVHLHLDLTAVVAL